MMKSRLYKINSPVYVRRLFVLCWIAYCISYVGRLNYSGAMTVMISEGLLDSSEAGFISMLYFFSYGIGQLINGFLGDKMHPGRMMMLGLGMSAAANAGMGITDDFVFMAVMWGINGYFQSMIWAPILRIFSEMLCEYDKIRCTVNIQSSSVAGTLFAYLLSAGLLSVFRWKSVFFVSAVLLLAVAAVFGIGFQNVLVNAGKYAQNVPEIPEEKEVKSDKETGSKSSFWKLVFGTEILLILVPTMIHGVLKDGVTAWVPTYISAMFGTQPSFSILLTTILPIVNLSGAYIGWEVYRKLKKNIAKTNLVFFTAAGAALLLLLIAGKVSVILTVAFLAVITCSMMAVNMLTISVYPLKFEKEGRVASTSGFLNAMAYLGSAISTFVIGILIEYRGWHDTIMTWLGITILASAIYFFAGKKIREDGKK